MYEMIPVVKALGFKVVTVDAGWYYQNGDYVPRDDTYPLGEADMKSFVKKFHDNGLKIKLWITTDIAGPEIIREHPEWLLRNEHGETTGFNYMRVQNTPYLCPALDEVQDYYRQLVRKFIGDWDFDGFKVDQSLINFVGRCYAPDHQHEYPEASVEAHPEISKILYEESAKLKPDAILEVCPCGLFPSYYNMPYYNQSISSDFVNPWQIRHRGKTLKALMGSGSAYYGDHMERYYSEENLPSMVGVGGIPGTMFVTRPEDNVEFLRVKYPCYLSPDREEHLSFWLDIYNDAMLSSGEYLNLYDIAFDLPETHVIRKKGIMHYNLFAPAWDGAVELRGLGEGSYSMIDYVNQKTLGTLEAGGSLHLKFEKHLFVKAVPTEQ
jgi:alpha-galactosidase